ncbi:MAG: hypothetical protein J6A88_09395 [Oscillospiraceae bacterium]|nr:hypothetical protein [Oscillospiraceae bacterium]
MINKQFDIEITQFNGNPPIACDHITALKLLREFKRDSIDFTTKFWPNPVGKYLPAVVEGTMFLEQESFVHDEAIKIAVDRVKNTSYQDVAHAFIHGIAKGIPAYRTALPAYLHIKNIPDHNDDRLRDDGSHTAPYCSFCNYQAASVETKMSFMWINAMQYCRIYEGGYLGVQNPADSSFLLREFLKMPKVVATKEDYQLFKDSLALAEQVQGDKKIGAYKEVLQKSKILPIKAREYQPYLDILGYLDILHTDEHHGITKEFIRGQDMQEAEEYKNDYAYPVRFWRGRNGVDWERVDELFGGIFK